MSQLRVSSIELVEDGQPPIIRCAVFDVTGVRHEFVDKLPVLSKSDTLATEGAVIACSLIALREDAAGRQVVTVDISCRGAARPPAA